MFSWTKWLGWGVNLHSKCESVVDYLHILNNVHVFKELREARASGINDALILANYLEKYASKPSYVELVKEIIQYNLRVYMNYNMNLFWRKVLKLMEGTSKC